MSSKTSHDGIRAPLAARGGEAHFDLRSMAAAEEILIEANEPEVEPQPSLTNRSRVRYELHNRAHAWNTEVSLFEGGWLSIRHHMRHKPGQAQLINLRFVDPKPSARKYTAKNSLRLAIGLLATSALSGTLAFFGIAPNVTIVAALCAGSGAMISLAVAAYRTHERFIFHTLTGRAPVIMIFSTIGCFRACRRLIPEISDAIKEAHACDGITKDQLLREEMREHYRLAETGILSSEVCTASTRKILAQFD